MGAGISSGGEEEEEEEEEARRCFSSSLTRRQGDLQDQRLRSLERLVARNVGCQSVSLLHERSNTSPLNGASPVLSVTVKKARFVCEDAEQFNSYVTLKLQNVKSTTVTVKGANPCWEQDFLFETNDMNAGLLVEVWCKGFLWDRFLGYYYIPLSEVSYMNEVTRNQCNLSRNEAQRQAESHTSSDMRDTNSNTQQDVIGDTIPTLYYIVPK
ncbi:Phorbol ester/diacylglycerol-binding protein unc-13 [Harpegnathos saltator]|uniref:Phorbol ester/diacylglycerol-binding protein unc-13 n=1 Tax=Harpegnathos saltator TaxID=610380 RepID=E2B3B3_HARSA|nr:Phorbol ester/diacylglycerol-binding protein unc-13 [Harpegnathos saltator]